MQRKITIIGAGLGGLSAAIRLAKLGFEVTILEKNETIGGKVNTIESNGYRFDTGASLLTMRNVLDDLFDFAGRDIKDYLPIVSCEPICRYFWSGGATLDASTDLERTENEIAKIERVDAANFRRFLADAKRKFEIAEKTFLAYSLNDLPRFLHPKYFKDLIAISSLKTLDEHNGSYFRSPKIRQLFNRFATYNGSSPFETPATFALVPYVEFGLGAWYVRGGMYEIPRALEKLARELNVKIKTNCEVKKIEIENGKAFGVCLKNGEILPSDFVVSNADAIETYRNLIDEKQRKDFPDKKLNKIEPSSSGFVLLLGVKKRFSNLAHHNIFFSDNYKAEFDAIFKERRLAMNPTIYVCAASRTDAAQSPEGCENLFVLVNAPYTSSQTVWKKEAKTYRDLIVKKLEGFGLEDLETSIEFEQTITPEDFENKYNANRGSIYGVSSNGIFSAFLRPPNKARGIENLYFVGGATHPGGGIPLVLLSGKMASELISKKLAADERR
ncbi:MAG: phytoene desaturase family protein [Acidobacteriota bacterium]|nr:phytoene desaturase [Acidobacteriota bacterium]MDQ3372862.1 phytoene desaturase family protein [Acidobacteriota bacterium]